MKKMRIWVILSLAPVLVWGVWTGFRKTKLALTAETDLFSQGQIALNQGNFSASIEVFDTFLVREPNHIPALQFKLTAEIRAGKSESAWGTAERLMKLDPSPTTRGIVAELFRQGGFKDLEKRVSSLPGATPFASPHQVKQKK